MKDILKRIRDGIELHRSMIKQYAFLELKRYKKAHEFFYQEDNERYLDLLDFYVSNYKEIPEEETIPIVEVKVEDKKELKEYIANSLSAYILFCKESSNLYKKKYDELLELGEMASACKLYDIICDTEYHLKVAEIHTANAKMMQYDKLWILYEQERLYNKYN